jgi:hypothetical protein
MKSKFFLLGLTLLAVACDDPSGSQSQDSESSISAAATAAPQAMMRVIACSTDAKDLRHPMIEVYIPRSLGAGEGQAAILAKLGASREVLGSYILDLSALGKGKSIEPVKVSLSSDKSGVIVNQFTRGLAPTTVPIAGAVVDFDHRFAEGATCPAFGVDPEAADL